MSMAQISPSQIFKNQMPKAKISKEMAKCSWPNCVFVALGCLAQESVTQMCIWHNYLGFKILFQVLVYGSNVSKLILHPDYHKILKFAEMNGSFSLFFQNIYSSKTRVRFQFQIQMHLSSSVCSINF